MKVGQGGIMTLTGAGDGFPVRANVKLKRKWC